MNEFILPYRSGLLRRLHRFLRVVLLQRHHRLVPVLRLQQPDRQAALGQLRQPLEHRAMQEDLLQRHNLAMQRIQISLERILQVRILQPFSQCGQRTDTTITFVCSFEVLRLDQSSGIDDIGAPIWKLVVCTFIVYCILYLSLFKGVKSSGDITN